MDILHVGTSAVYSSIRCFTASSKAIPDSGEDFSATLERTSDQVALSEAARVRAASDSPRESTCGRGEETVMDTDQGRQAMDLEAYFSETAPAKGSGTLSDALPPLMPPTRENVRALADHVSSGLPGFLEEHDIPEAPSSITYDPHGMMVLPPDYAHAAEFEAALSEDPAMERALRTVNALTSHRVAMEEALQFQEEYAAASSKDEVERIIAKYGVLFVDDRQYPEVSLRFTPEGDLTLTADGKAIYRDGAFTGLSVKSTFPPSRSTPMPKLRSFQFGESAGSSQMPPSLSSPQ